MKPRADQALSEREQQGHHHHHLDGGQTQFCQQIVIATGKRRQQDQQGHHGQILKQQNPDGQLSMGLGQLQPLGQQFAGNGCRRHRHRPADRQRQRKTARHHRHGPSGDHQGSDHLAGPHPKDQMTHGLELGQGKLQANGEHHEHDTDFTQKMGLLAFRYQVRDPGASQKPHDQIAQHGRHPYRAA